MKKVMIYILFLLVQLYLVCSSINDNKIVKRNGNREEYCKKKVNITEECLELAEISIELKFFALGFDIRRSIRLTNFRKNATNYLNDYCMTDCLDDTLEFFQCVLNDSSPIIIQLALDAVSNVTCSLVNGTYCIVQIYEAQISGESPPLIQTLAICNGSVGICRENCSINLQRAKASLGCCLETFASNTLIVVDDDPDPNQILQIVIDYPSCGVQPSGRCPTSIPTEAPNVTNATTGTTSKWDIIKVHILLSVFYYRQ